MLVLTREAGEEIILSGAFGKIRVAVVRVHGNLVRLGFDAPPEVDIVRKEIEGKPKKEKPCPRQ